MTKIQKIWLGVFLAMFIVPEVLWSPVINFLYELCKNTGFPLRGNFLEKTANINILSFVLFLQMIGLLFSSVYLALLHKRFEKRIILWVTSALLFLGAILVFFLFGISVSIRGFNF